MQRMTLQTSKGFALLLLVGLAASLPRVATPQTQTEMNIAAGKEYARADKAMNVAYQKLRAKLDAKGQARLKKAQLAWIQFRDAETEFLASKEEGGSIYPMIYANHKTEITQQRTKELKAAYTLFTTEGRM